MKRWLPLLSVVLVAGGYMAWVLSRPLPSLKPRYSVTTQEAIAPSPDIAWSQYGQQALGIYGHGVVATHGEQKAAPMASTAKVMLALSVLEKHPLALKQSGPEITITAADVATYQQFVASGQSVTAVRAGVPITQYQALQAILLPSSNNIAHLLANWAFGSQESYVNYANSYAKRLGMNNTTFADASGFSPATKSTAGDLVMLGLAAVENPVIAEIVAQNSATIPVAGVIKNTNFVLNQSGINGIKTGSTDAAGGCFVFSTSFEGTPLVAAIIGAPDRGTALHDAPAIANSFKKAVQVHPVLIPDTAYVTYTAPWGADVEAKVQQTVSVIDWTGSRHAIKISAKDLAAPNKAGEQVGTASFVYQGKTYEGQLLTTKQLAKPNLWWRLTHPRMQ